MFCQISGSIVVIAKATGIVERVTGLLRGFKYPAGNGLRTVHDAGWGEVPEEAEEQRNRGIGLEKGPRRAAEGSGMRWGRRGEEEERKSALTSPRSCLLKGKTL
jgi:hypothetical protein